MLTSSCLTHLRKAWCRKVPVLLDASFYTSPELLSLEIKNIFRRTWLYVCHSSMVAEPNSVLTVDVANSSVLITRNHDGVLKAFYNVCSHRSALLSTGKGTQKLQCLVCPYHGWTFNLDGQLRAVPESKNFSENIRPEKHSLKSIRIEEWKSLIFICFDKETPNLQEYLGIFAKKLDKFPIKKTSLLFEKDYPVSCNWKTFHDNSLCDYHINIVHRETLKDIQGPISEYKYFFDKYVNLLSTPITEAWSAENKISDEVDESLQSQFLTFAIFPNLHILVLPDASLIIERIDPVSVNECRVHTEAYSIGSTNPTPENSKRWYDAIFQEDQNIVEGVQKGYTSASDFSGPIHDLESRMLHQQHLIRNFMIDSLKSF